MIFKITWPRVTNFEPQKKLLPALSSISASRDLLLSKKCSELKLGSTGFF